MFAPDAIAMALTVAASAVPVVGGALKSYLFRKDRSRNQGIVITSGNGNILAGDLAVVSEATAAVKKPGRRARTTDSTYIEGQRDAAEHDETVSAEPPPSENIGAVVGSREIPTSPNPRRTATWAPIGVALLTPLVLLLVVATIVEKYPEGKPTLSEHGYWNLPQVGAWLFAALVWLSGHEFFYQLLFLFAVLFIVLFNKRRFGALVRRLDASGQLLFGFACIVFYFGGSAAIHYWQRMYLTADKFYLALGLFFTMVGGMFVQVISANYKSGAASLFAVTTAELIYPVLFSPIVYYAIWAVASASASAGLFSFYAAFLNGYFWQSVVTSAQKASVVGSRTT